MTCIKTGAHVYFWNYGFMAAADVFEVMDTLVIRWNPGSISYYSGPTDNATHEVLEVINSDSWWHRDDLGVTVVPRYLVRER